VDNSREDANDDNNVDNNNVDNDNVDNNNVKMIIWRRGGEVDENSTMLAVDGADTAARLISHAALDAACVRLPCLPLRMIFADSMSWS
jgi:hypothetical protein